MRPHSHIASFVLFSHLRDSWGLKINLWIINSTPKHPLTPAQFTARYAYAYLCGDLVKRLALHKRISCVETKRGIQVGALLGPAPKKTRKTMEDVEDVEDMFGNICMHAYFSYLPRLPGLPSV